MSSILGSQAVVLATAMVVSSTVLYLAFSNKHRPLSDQEDISPDQKLRSCLCSEGKKRKRKNKKVQFAANVKDSKGNGEEYRREKSRTRIDRNCRNGIPANRIALYNGILRDRVHRMECSH